MDPRDVIARLESEVARLEGQNRRVRLSIVAVGALAALPWLLAFTSQGARQPNNLTVDRIHFDGPNGGVTLRSIDAPAGADSRGAAVLGVFAGTGDALAASFVAAPAGSELRIGDRGGVRIYGGGQSRGRVEVLNDEGKTGAELLAAPGGGGSVVVRGPGGAGVAVLETATDGSGQMEVRDPAGRIIQRIP